MKRTNEASESSNSITHPPDGQAKRSKAESDSDGLLITSASHDETDKQEQATTNAEANNNNNQQQSFLFPTVQPLPMMDPFAVPPTNNNNMFLNAQQLPFSAAFHQPHHPPTLAELTLARANRNNALEAAQHQLATAVLRQTTSSDGNDMYSSQSRFQQAAAVNELLMRQQQQGMMGYGSSSPMKNTNNTIGFHLPGGGGGMTGMDQTSTSTTASPYLMNTAPSSTTTAAADARIMTPKQDPATMIPNYSFLLNNSAAATVAPHPLMNPSNSNNTTNFMSLSKEEQQGHLLALARSTQTGVSTSKKLGPFIPGIAHRGEAFYDPGQSCELSLSSDRGNLSEYQCLLRKQILLFAVTMNDIQCSAQGRNKPIVLGQVGVLCRHCATIPPGMRPCGAAYFPAKLNGLYQASQNMAINHFTKSCRSIPPDLKETLIKLKAQKSTVLGGGKHFWANGAKVLGVVEMQDGLLRFQKDNGPAVAEGGGEDTATTSATV